MRRMLIRSGLISLLLTGLFCNSIFSQSVTGIWRGYFVSESGQQYRLEFQVKQTGGQVSVTGVSYSWQDDIRFYGKATMTGNFLKPSSTFRIHEIKTVEVKSGLGGGTCIMNYDLRYTKSGKEEFLEGTYLGKQETEGPNSYQWGDCGGGRVYLRRVVTTDFYVEPFLRDKTAKVEKPKTEEPKLEVPKAETPLVTTKPPVEKNTVKTTPKKTNPPKTNTPVKKDIAKNNTKVVTKPPVKPKTQEQVIDTARVKAPVITQTPIKIPGNIPSILKSRSNELMKSLVVNDPNVIVKLYDNGEIDDDSISVYLDKKLILSNRKLSTAPIVIKLKMDDENPDHELVMVAENLGRIPPNTSLMIVEAGSQTFEVRITSTEQKNALVRFRYEKP